MAEEPPQLRQRWSVSRETNISPPRQERKKVIEPSSAEISEKTSLVKLPTQSSVGSKEPETPKVISVFAALEEVKKPQPKKV